MISKKEFTVDELKRKLEYYCAYQERCLQEIEKKMVSYNVAPKLREFLLLHLKENDFLNEERFSRSFALGKFRIKKWGKQRIVRELKFREIPSHTIKIALEEIEEEEYLISIYTITERKNKLISETDVLKRKKKLIDFLLRKGYESDLIYKVVGEIVNK